MDRTIKFRAWDNRNKKMISWNELLNSKELLQSFFGNEHYPTNPPRYFYERMQFTGLYDSEGKEIWEGDIVEIQNESQYTKKEYWYPIYEIQNDGWKFKLKYIKGGLHSDNEFLVRQNSTEKVKVLGNIYEHPNLLQ